MFWVCYVAIFTIYLQHRCFSERILVNTTRPDSKLPLVPSEVRGISVEKRPPRSVSFSSTTETTHSTSPSTPSNREHKKGRLWKRKCSYMRIILWLKLGFRFSLCWLVAIMFRKRVVATYVYA